MVPSVAVQLSTGELHNQLIAELIELAIKEDLGPEGIDVTTDALVPKDAIAVASLYCKQAGVIAGLAVADQIFRIFAAEVQWKGLAEDGQTIEQHQLPLVIASVRGPARAILKAERLALNIMQRMSGIATLTREHVNKAAPFGIAILDTRKTTPGMRALEKLAVRCGSGTNHRFGLYDAVLIKDNHIAIAGGVKQAIQRMRAAQPDRAIEIETTTLTEVEEVLELGVERIMLDNMSPALIRQAVDVIGGRAFIEVSGGVNLQNLESYLIRGVNAISIGAITHAARSLDISLEVEKLQ